MSPREVVNDFLTRHFVGVALAILSGGIAYGLIQAKVDGKADQAVVDAMATEIRTIKYLLCKQTPHDSACNGARP